MAIWDAALEHGSKGTRYTQALLRALSQPVFGDRRCPPSQTVLVVIAASLKMSQLWNTSATVAVHFILRIFYPGGIVYIIIYPILEDIRTLV